MDTSCLVKMAVVLEPVGCPWVIVQEQLQQLVTTTSFNFEFDAINNSYLKIQHCNKALNDPSTAVIIKEISFFGIADPRFILSGTYYPDYPEHYVNKITPLPGQGYLGWNGVYKLEFSVPVFSWIHRELNMGWMYQ